LNTYYLPNSSTAGPDHNVGIIGWDDNATTKYTQKGAWLCKNSWGTSNIPYFYISYWDKHCCRHIDESCVSLRNVVPLAYKKVYFHDYHGWRGSLKTAKECFNKFVAANSADQYLIDVSFFTLTVNEEWEIKVYDKYTGGTLQDELASASGKIFAIGYHTVKLNHPVTLKNGDDFYIYLKVKNGALAYDRTSSPFNPLGGEKFRADALVPSKAAADQSYYRTSETSPWTDLFNYEESITVNSQKVNCKGTHNFCIKGYAIDTMPVGIQSTPFMPCNNRFNLVNYPNPFASRTSIQYSVLENSSVWIEIFTVSGRVVYSFAVQKHTSAGTFKTAWEGRDQNGKPVSDGVYYAVLRVKTGRQIVSEKLKMCMAK